MIIEYVAMVIKILVFVSDIADINYVAMHWLRLQWMWAEWYWMLWLLNTLFFVIHVNQNMYVT
jgi:hypothetical protein